MCTSAPQSQSPVEAGPLWGLLLVLTEIAERLSREQVQETSAPTVAESDTPSFRKPGQRQASGAAAKRDAPRA